MSQPNKKRKQDLELSSPLKKREPLKSQPKNKTISVCVPTSIIHHCQNLQQVTNVVYQLAKLLCIYNIGEIIVLDVHSDKAQKENIGKKKILFAEEEHKEETLKLELMVIASLLQFFITPPYLVKTTFTKQQISNFQYAMKLPKISTLPFMLNNSSNFKEGLSIPRKKTKKNLTKYINIGEQKPCIIDQEIPANVRVTVDTKQQKIVSPFEAYGVSAVSGHGFGYLVRPVKNFNEIFTQAGVGTSGYTKSLYCNCGDFFENQISGFEISKDVSLQDKEKLLLICGEMRVLQWSFKNDDTLSKLGLESFKQMCDFEMDIVKGCNLEDGVLIALTKLNSII